MNELLLRRRNVIISGAPSLPYDAEIEYLEGTNGACIDTGILASSNIKIEILTDRPLPPQNGSTWTLFATSRTNVSRNLNYTVFESTNSSNQKYIAATYMRSSSKLDTPSGSLSKSLFVFDGGILHYDNNSRTLYTADRGKSFTGVDNIGLFNRLDGVLTTYVNVVIYYCKMFNQGTLVRDFIPVRIGQVGYLYDNVSSQLFGNVGTGGFILGNDVN